MATIDPFLPGAVAWSGDNPSLVLQVPGAADYSVMVSLFQVRTSPHGAGTAAVVLEPSKGSAGLAHCLTDNEPLARHLVADYLSHFGLFAGRAALQTLRYLPLRDKQVQNHLPQAYAVTLKAEQRQAEQGQTGHGETMPLSLELRWSALGPPYMIAMPPQGSPTGKHWLYSTFLIAQSAQVRLNDQRLPGQVAPRQQAGRAITSAFLALSETWLEAAD